MKKILYVVFSLLLGGNLVNAQSVSISSPYSAPDVSARLDVSATNKGLLIPRVSLTSLTDAATIATPAVSLLVYNTNATLGVGYYYNNGTTGAPKWTKILTSATGWTLTGNGGTDTAKNFIGTTDNLPLRFRINNIKSGLLSLSNVYLGDSVAVDGKDAVSAYNVAIGRKVMVNDDTASYNVAVGAYAMNQTTTDDESVAVGFAALYGNDDYYGGGNLNTAVGSNAMGGSVDGYYSTGIGAYTLTYGTSGAGNTAVGMFADCYDTLSGLDIQNATALGYGALALASNEVRIGDDNVTAIDGAVDFSVLSDGRYKRDIKEDKGGLGFIMQLRPVNYRYNYQAMNTERIRQLKVNKERDIKLGHLAAANKTDMLLNRLNSKQNKLKVALSERPVYNGMIAQEVEAAANKIGYNFSGVVKPTTPNGRYSLRYATFVVPLIEAVQQQQRIIEDQNKKINALIKRIEVLENK